MAGISFDLALQPQLWWSHVRFAVAGYEVSSPGWSRASAHHHDRVRVDHHCECRATAPPQRHVAGRPCLRNV